MADIIIETNWSIEKYQITVSEQDTFLSVSNVLKDVVGQRTFIMTVEGVEIEPNEVTVSELGLLSGDVIVLLFPDDVKSRIWLEYNKINISTSSLTTAVESSNVDVVRNLIDAGLQFSVTDYMILAIRLRYTELASLLKNKFPNDCTPSKPGIMTPLHWAAITGNIVAVRFLLEDYCSPSDLINLSSSEGMTVLHCAVKKPLNKEVIGYLLSFNPDCNIKTKKGQSVLILACSEGCPSNLESLLSFNNCELDLSDEDRMGNTALHHLAKCGCPDAVRVVLRCAYFNKKLLGTTNRRGLTPRGIAKKRGMETMRELLSEAEDVLDY